jgi:hypothetical protein
VSCLENHMSLRYALPGPCKNLWCSLEHMQGIFNFLRVLVHSGSCIITIYAPMIYIYSPVHNVLDACISSTRASGRGLGPRILEFFGPCEMASSRKASAIWGPKNSLALVMDMHGHASKTLCRGCINHWRIGAFMNTRIP